MTDIRGMFGETKFNLRACGMLKNDDTILVSHEIDGTNTLTGGAVKIGESTEEAVVREFLEETNFYVEVVSLKAVIENFFTIKDMPYQEIIFVYEVAFQKGKRQELICREKPHVAFEKIENIKKLKPEPLNDLIHHLDSDFKHYIYQE